MGQGDLPPSNQYFPPVLFSHFILSIPLKYRRLHSRRPARRCELGPGRPAACSAGSPRDPWAPPPAGHPGLGTLGARSPLGLRAHLTPSGAALSFVTWVPVCTAPGTEPGLQDPVAAANTRQPRGGIFPPARDDTSLDFPASPFSAPRAPRSVPKSPGAPLGPGPGGAVRTRSSGRAGSGTDEGRPGSPAAAALSLRCTC